MALVLPRRLLDAVPDDQIFHSADADGDPRFGDCCSAADAVPEGATVVVLLGVPQHLGVERNGGRPGAAGAPEAIRRAFYRLATSASIDVFRSGRLALVDAGNLRTDGKTLEQIHDEQEDVVHTVLRQGALPVVLGGGHDTAWPTIRAMDRREQPWGAINVDAHADVRPLQDGTRAHSGSPFRQMLTAPASYLAAGSFVDFGLQHHAVAASHLDFIRAQGHHAVMLDDIRTHGADAVWAQAWSRATAPGRTYLSVDMDAFASAYAPGVSAPATDGFAPAEVRPWIRAAGADAALAAFDLVEVNPVHDVDGRTARLAAVLLADLVAGLASRLRAAGQ